ncbi:hypothetical protein FMEAI12_7050019 [Parafrankia sp. Ea1.12]|nr:hypothetical protein FMEAI12_7050019 [Parafrankia sp. Ea1.12]
MMRPSYWDEIALANNHRLRLALAADVGLALSVRPAAADEPPKIS